MDAFDIKKKIVIWILILAGIFVLSDFLIYVGLNSTYKDIQRKDNISQVTVYQADATYVNGRIRGIIKNTDKIKQKYLKIELYTKRDVLVGKSYIEVQNNIKDDESQPFEVLFKANDVAYYKIEAVNEKEAGSQLEILPKEWTKSKILVATALTFLIFW